MSADQDILGTSRPTQAGGAPALEPEALATRTPPAPPIVEHSTEPLSEETESPVPPSVDTSGALSSEEKTTASHAFPSIPTVWIEDENSEEQVSTSSPVWYAPTCVSDFDLAWVEFVMQQYYENNFDKDVKKPTVRRFTVDMAGAPDEKASKGYVILLFISTC